MATRRPDSTPTPKNEQAFAPKAPARRVQPTEPKSNSAATRSVTAEARRAMIAQAAYFHAERRGFAPGGEEQDWLKAEAEVDALLEGATHGRAPQ
jgi:hypothetical protein